MVAPKRDASRGVAGQKTLVLSRKPVPHVQPHEHVGANLQRTDVVVQSEGSLETVSIHERQISKVTNEQTAVQPHIQNAVVLVHVMIRMREDYQVTHLISLDEMSIGVLTTSIHKMFGSPPNAVTLDEKSTCKIFPSPPGR
jgi:hypothetical protein